MNIISEITQIDLFKRNGNQWDTGIFIGRPFSINYSSALILVPDAWKERAGGIPQSCFLIAYYQNEIEKPDAAEAVLLRVIRPAKLPSEPEVIASMIEYYKGDIRTGETKDSQLDTFTRYEFSFSGLECSILGSFYRDTSGKVRFGADLENFYSAHNYGVLKPSPAVLKAIVNYRESGSPGGAGDVHIGKVRYSSSQRFQSREKEEVPVYVLAPDFAGKRTALFGMTRTGKSNTLKKIIQACVEMSDRAANTLGGTQEGPESILEPFTESNDPKYPIGQIIFDINGEYANPNLQDQGTAIFEIYKDRTTRYSTIKKAGFREMKVNFYDDISTGVDLIRSYPSIAEDDARYVTSFRTADLEKPEDYTTNRSASTRYDRRKAVYLCCLFEAKFDAPPNFKVYFSANKDVRDAIEPQVDPSKGMTLEEASLWWSRLWEIYETAPCFVQYKEKNKGKEWADDDLKAVLVMLTRKRTPGGQADCSGFRILKPVLSQHTSTLQKPFEDDILEQVRSGKIIIVDLSQGDPNIQAMFSERICRRIFNDSMKRFTETKPNNFVQFYFEEAHNLFPKKEEKDLSQIYNRLAKEGAKLNLGLIYATQEVSSISSNILKATQNWFISHLNNEDEIKELKKYYDFSDFAEGLIKFSQDTDKGFIRMKTYSKPFVIPVQVDRFPSK